VKKKNDVQSIKEDQTTRFSVSSDFIQRGATSAAVDKTHDSVVLRFWNSRQSKATNS